MNVILVTLACGHPPVQWRDGDGSPRCPLCGSATVARVVAPPPRLTGAVVLPRQEGPR